MARRQKQSSCAQYNAGCGCLAWIAIIVWILEHNGIPAIRSGIIGISVFVGLLLIYVFGKVGFESLRHYGEVMEYRRQSRLDEEHTPTIESELRSERYESDRRERNRLRAVESEFVSDGYEFERFIAQKLRRVGINAIVTRGSNDQGVDILATNKQGTRIAIQVKFYRSPVSNKAIQEVYSGMAHYNCNVACVVTNSTFTKSAKALAQSTGVKLIEGCELHALDSSKHWICQL